MTIRTWISSIAAITLLVGTVANGQIAQPSFVPIIGPSPTGLYGPGAPGFTYAEYNYNGGVIINNNAPNNYNVTVSGAPVPNAVFGPVNVGTLDYGNRNTVSTENKPYLGGGRNDFTSRGKHAFVQFTMPGAYTLHHGADDTTYTVIDTVADGTVVAQNPCCGDFTTPLNITQPGIFALDFVFGEQGGGEYQELGISGPGITGTVSLGDTQNGSPAVFEIAFAAVPEPASIAIWTLLGLAAVGFGYRRWRK